jgi:hypothetical protein
MKTSLTKPRKLASGKRVPYWGVRMTMESVYEEQAIRQLYPTLGKAPKGKESKGDTEAWLKEITRAVEHRAHLLAMGMPVQDTASIESRTAEFVEWGKVQGGKKGLKWAEGHDAHVDKYLKDWTAVLGLRTLSDIRQAPFDREIVRLSKTLAPNTVNHRARALTSLCSWAVRQGYLPALPIRFRALDKTPVRERGAFTLDEMKLLFSQVPWARSLLYRAAYYLRLRRAELASLRVSSVLWADGFIRLDYKDAKDRRTAMIPVPAKLLADLWEASQGKPDTAKLFDFSKKHAARCLHRDMQQLGIPVEMSGRRRDFHSLGASTATSMDRRGVAPALASKTMRHKSWAQTENYIKLETEQVRVVTQGLEDEIEHTDNTLEARMRGESITTGLRSDTESSPSPSAPPRPGQSAKPETASISRTKSSRLSSASTLAMARIPTSAAPAARSNSAHRPVVAPVV